MTRSGPLGPANLARHPLDPEPVASTKANMVLLLGLVGLVTGPFVGGVVPAVAALMLARQARAEFAASRGYLTGGDRVHRGELFAMLGLGLAALTLVIGAVAMAFAVADNAGAHDFPDSVD